MNMLFMHVFSSIRHLRAFKAYYTVILLNAVALESDFM